MVRWFRNFISTLASNNSIPPQPNWRRDAEKYDRERDKRLKDSPYWQKIRGEKENEYIDRLRGLYHAYNFLHKGSEALFTREDSLRFVDDLAEKGFVVLGVTCWYTASLIDGTQGIAEDLEYSLGFEEEILFREHPVKESTPEVKKFISELPKRITYVSFYLFIPMVWDWELFPEKWQAGEQNQAKK